jgi:hypothetical protein
MPIIRGESRHCRHCQVRDELLPLHSRAPRCPSLVSPLGRFLFIAPPSMEALEARLRGRGTEKEVSAPPRAAVESPRTCWRGMPPQLPRRGVHLAFVTHSFDSEEKILTRLANARDEVEFSQTEGFWDCVLVNDDLDKVEMQPCGLLPVTFVVHVTLCIAWHAKCHLTYAPSATAGHAQSGLAAGLREHETVRLLRRSPWLRWLRVKVMVKFMVKVAGPVLAPMIPACRGHWPPLAPPHAAAGPWPGAARGRWMHAQRIRTQPNSAKITSINRFF